MRLPSIVLMLTAAACGSSPAPESGAKPRTLTFNKDIAPILVEHCGSCHRPGDRTAASRIDSSGARASSSEPWCIAGAPFSLIDYGDAAVHARQVADVVRKRTMPPWLPEPGYGLFANERRLTSEQIEAIEWWAAHGTPEGDPADKPAVPDWPDGWQLGTPDLVVTLPASYTLRATGADVFRNFVLPDPVATTRYVRAMELRTDNPRVLHHASVGVDITRASRRLDRADLEPGFAVMPEGEVRNVYGWSPGKAPYMAPPGQAWTLEAGSDLVLQMHMLPSGKPETIRPTIGLFFTDQPPAETPLIVTLQSKTIDLEAGRAGQLIEDRYVLPADADVRSVYPHAHALATDMKVFATLPDQSVTWLLWIKSWDFNWQDTYRYASPVRLPQGTVLTMRFTYDNSEQNPRNPNHPVRRVRWGPGSSDEMAAVWLEITPRRPEDAALFARDAAERAMRADLANAEMQAGAEPGDPHARNYLAARYLQAGRVADAIAQLGEALRLDPQDAEAHSNLGIARQLQNQIPDAIRELETAARLKPDDDRVHVNLGNALHAGGRDDRAIREYRRAIDIDPENADAHVDLALVLGPAGQIDGAIVHLKRALTINPRNASVHRNLGIALGLKGQRDQAIAELREALRIQPAFDEARRNLDELLSSGVPVHAR
jgi:tetratricopeptide (TPR) repeat protein